MIKPIPTRKAQNIRHQYATIKSFKQDNLTYLLNIPFNDSEINLLINANSMEHALDIYSNSKFGFATRINEDDAIELSAETVFLGANLDPHYLNDVTIHTLINYVPEDDSEMLEAA